jgi:hypothetical protein
MSIQMEGEGKKKKGVKCDLVPPNTPIPTGGRKRRVYEKPWPLWYYSIPCGEAKTNGRMKTLPLRTLQSWQEGETKGAYEKSWPLLYYSNPCRKAKSNMRMKKSCRFDHPNPGRRVKRKGSMKNLDHYCTAPILAGKRKAMGV